MGKLILRSGMTVDGVIDQIDRWFIPEASTRARATTSSSQLTHSCWAGRPTRAGWRLADHWGTRWSDLTSLFR
jgi:hypothetical protein